jgi:hypothetical protein
MSSPSSLPIEERVQKVIEEGAKEIVEKAKKDIEMVADRTLKELDRMVLSLKEASKLMLPVNVLEILERKGRVFVSNIDLPYMSDVNVEVRIGPYSVLFDQIRGFSEGKYRIVLILDRSEKG